MALRKPGEGGLVYSTEAGMTGYTWTITSGGMITSGTGTNSVTVSWNGTGAQTVSVNYANLNGCLAPSPTVYNVTVNAAPTPTITGANTLCVNSGNYAYTTQTETQNHSSRYMHSPFQNPKG